MSETPEDQPRISIEVTAPIPQETVKRKFKENIEFVIDYDNSKFKGRMFITYLSNLDVPATILLPNVETGLELAAEYLKVPTLVSMPDLEDIIINVLLALRGKPNHLAISPERLMQYYEANKDHLDRWMRRICSLPLYTLQCSKEHQPQVADYPVDEDESLAGINFVQLIRHELFALLVDDIPPQNWTHQPKFFNEYIFAGKNLYHYFAHPENPLFMALLFIIQPDKAEELKQGMPTEPLPLSWPLETHDVPSLQ